MDLGFGEKAGGEQAVREGGVLTEYPLIGREERWCEALFAQDAAGKDARTV